MKEIQDQFQKHLKKSKLDNEIVVEDNQMITIEKNEKTLVQVFEEYDGENNTKEFEWDNPIGKELI